MEEDDDGMSTTELAQPATDQCGSGITLQEAAEFIWREAEMLDRHDYKPWLALWAPGSHYVIPIEQDEKVDAAGALNIAYDDVEMREARVKRLRSGFAMSSAPAARTARTVSRFVTLGDDAGVLTVRAVQHIVEYKFERTRILAAEVLYGLRRTGPDIALARKEIRLINSDDPLWGIGYLL
ncbi:aromatic-ring-hydroxylating dioxygenase subunit beta [Sphingomonas koreensis]